MKKILIAFVSLAGSMYAGAQQAMTSTGNLQVHTGASASGNVFTAGTIDANITRSFGSFTLGYKTYPVPLILISLTAERKKGVSCLRWITGNEQNVGHFDIQRSYDAADFTTIGNTPAINNGTQENYLFEDHSPLTGFAWYRLRSVDINGKARYSKIVIVSETATPTGAFVVISPVRGVINILNKTGHGGEFRYSVTNSAAQVIIKGIVSMKGNGGAMLLLPKSITGGIYVLNISDDITRFRRRILIEK